MDFINHINEDPELAKALEEAANKYYGKKIADLKTQLKNIDLERQRVLKEIESLEKQLAGKPQPKREVANDYPLTGTWSDKIEYILHKYKKPLTSKELIEEILEEEKVSDDKKKYYKNSISATLSQNKSLRFKRMPAADGDSVIRWFYS